jgi:hypothetical protein
MEVIFGFSILENIKFTKNIPCSWKKKLFLQTCVIKEEKKKNPSKMHYVLDASKVNYCNYSIV